MKLKEKLALDFVREFSQILPGSFDTAEGLRCYLVGFQKCREMAVDKMCNRCIPCRKLIEHLGEQEV